ncbi:hypothetical protein B0H11DRAFT_2082043 [Mycena galericulata]|nr:hypothetical protein B0H11DRAFT_2082043 [Mycena galericulata]
MSLHAYPAAAPAYASLNISTARAEYPAPYHNAGPASSTFAVGSSLGADHLEHSQWTPRYFHDHARGTQSGGPSTAPPRYSGTNSSAARYATGVPISGYGARPSFSSRPAGRAWQDAPASANDVQGLAVHGHVSEALQPLRYSAAAAASRSAPSPVMSSSSCSSGSGSGVFKSGEGVVLASPTPQIPSPAQMAILLKSAAGDQQQDSYGDTARPRALNNNLRAPVAYAVMFPDMSEPATAGELEEDADAIEEGFLSREKKHGCTMCHKRFDRPSTLKKHLLVHTGEKAFQCPICERRFGVMSNLNRHIRRCSLREVHTHGSAPASSAAASTPERPAPVVTGKRARTPPTSAASESVPGNGAAPSSRKRRRRPPSPSRWVPASLSAFNILAPEANKPAPVPLHPVSPTRVRPAPRYDSDSGSDGPQWDEERDSWDENVGRAPYAPGEWAKKHRLPGPCGMKFGGAVGGNYNADSEYGYGGGGSRVRNRAIRV